MELIVVSAFAVSVIVILAVVLNRAAGARTPTTVIHEPATHTEIVKAMIATNAALREALAEAHDRLLTTSEHYREIRSQEIDALVAEAAAAKAEADAKKQVTNNEHTIIPGADVNPPGGW